MARKMAKAFLLILMVKNMREIIKMVKDQGEENFFKNGNRYEGEFWNGVKNGKEI